MNTEKCISAGCQLCQEGKWLCIFLTYVCDAACPFCPSPFKDRQLYSSLGRTKKTILGHLQKNTIGGIAFSGGEIFLEFDRLHEWLSLFVSRFPGIYYWGYTNGMMASRKKLAMLADAGMDEIRFNIAASDYLSLPVLKNIDHARTLFSFVSVEIPSIHQDFDKLCIALKELDAIGIDYLNLHDLILPPSGDEEADEPCEIHSLDNFLKVRIASSSKQNTHNVLRFCEENNLSFHINHCSIEKKKNQMVQRRIRIGSLFINPDYDFITEQGVFYTFFRFPAEPFNLSVLSRFSDYRFCSSNQKKRIRKDEIQEAILSGDKIVSVCFQPPTEYDQRSLFLSSELICKDELPDYLHRIVADADV
jgi:uncharacterized protein